jgi:hypothetical protein
MDIQEFCLPVIPIILGLGLEVNLVRNLIRKKNKPLTAKRFDEAEQKFQRLKEKYDAKVLTEAQFKTLLQDMMVQDEQGRWWMIGYETGQWYYHDGEKWVPGASPAAMELKNRISGHPGGKSVRKTMSVPMMWLSGLGGLILLALGLIWLAENLGILYL